MIRNHVHHLHHVIDDKSLPMRGLITIVALLSLPLFGTGVRTVGEMFNLGQLVLPLLVVAHVPAVIVIIAIWSIGCDVCRTEGAG